MGCIRLEQLGISHRDIRASNIFYVQKQQRYMLGGFYCARETEEDEQLLTVNGIEIQAEGHLRQLIAEKQNVPIELVDGLVSNKYESLLQLETFEPTAAYAQDCR